MKEAVGGTWLAGIVFTFVVLFTTFISVSTNYSRCFRIKDEIISTIEHFDGVNTETIKAINAYVGGIGYASTGNCENDDTQFESDDRSESEWVGFISNNTSKQGTEDVNYCIKRYIISDKYCGDGVINGPIGQPRSAYYQVVVFFKLNWPILDQIFNVRISGETSVIYNWNDEALDLGDC